MSRMRYPSAAAARACRRRSRRRSVEPPPARARLHPASAAPTLCIAAMPAAARSPAQDVCCFCHRPGDPRVPGELAVLVNAPAPPRPTLTFHEACAGYSAAVAWGRRVGKERIPYGAGEVGQGAAGRAQQQGLRAGFDRNNEKQRRSFTRAFATPPAPRSPPSWCTPSGRGAPACSASSAASRAPPSAARACARWEGPGAQAWAGGLALCLQLWRPQATGGAWLTLRCLRALLPLRPAVPRVLAPAVRPPGGAGGRGRGVLCNHARGGLRPACRQVGCPVQGHRA